MSDGLVEDLRNEDIARGTSAMVMRCQAADEIVWLKAELERTRQAWVDGDDPLCDDVCMVACKGPCEGVRIEADDT